MSADTSISGPLSLHLVAMLLGKRYDQMPAVIKHDKLPVVPVGAGLKPIQKVYKTQLLKWLNARRSGGVGEMTLKELEQELRDCQARLAEGAARAKGRRLLKEEAA